MQISQKTFDFIVAQEVSSKAYYQKHYMRPEWPGLSSGPTVGIGYDLGQCKAAKIKKDWQDVVPPLMLEQMMSCAGKTATAGRNKTAQVKNKISIPWDAAMHVFATRDVPQWTGAVLKAVPGSDKLCPDHLGVLVDLAYNRGIGGFNSTNSRFKEMRAIRNYVTSGQLEKVAPEFWKMKRLWPNTRGLRLRCDKRKTIWEDALGNPNQPVAKNLSQTPFHLDPDMILESGAARTTPPPVTPVQAGSSIFAGLAALGGSIEAFATGSIGVPLFIFGIFISFLIATTIWILWYRTNNPA
jgi:hypothetical protein